MSEVLLQAIRNNTLQDVIDIVTEGADVNYQNDDPEDDGYTPLIEATLDLKVDVMEYLLQRGALVDKPDHDGMTPINHLYTEQVYDDEQALLPALRLLHEYHANLNHPNRAEDTFIQWAAFNGHIAIVTFLLNAGIDPRTALDDALEGEHQTMITLLQTAIDDLEMTDSLTSDLDDAMQLYR